MASTIPARSAVTVTPWTAVAEPMALSVAGHSSWRAVLVVTASGGMRNDAACAVAVRI